MVLLVIYRCILKELHVASSQFSLNSVKFFHFPDSFVPIARAFQCEQCQTPFHAKRELALQCILITIKGKILVEIMK